MTVTDGNVSPSDSATITLSDDGTQTISDANGTLSGTGLLETSPGVYTLGATDPASLTSELDALVFTPTLGEVPAGNSVTTDFALAVTDANGTASNNATSVVATASGVACFARGTRLLTVRGEVMVEHLAVGDRMVTGSGERPIVWIGYRRIDLTRHADPRVVQPIRIRAGAFAEARPHRDLLVSPDHALFVDGKLIVARQLLNGTSIIQVTAARRVTYFHIELDRHDILLAEGLPTESYLDTGNRAMFANGGLPPRLHPDFGEGQSAREAGGCAPFVDDPNEIEPVWHRLAKRAATLGWYLAEPPVFTEDADLHVRLDGRRFNPIQVTEGRYLFVLPASSGSPRLVSRASRPVNARPWLIDRRELGIKVRRLTIRRGQMVREPALDDPALAQGWWQVESSGDGPCRWTDGNARLPPLGAGILEVDVADSIQYDTVTKCEGAAAVMAWNEQVLRAAT